MADSGATASAPQDPPTLPRSASERVAPNSDAPNRAPAAPLPGDPPPLSTEDSVDLDALAAERVVRRAMELESEALRIAPIGVSQAALEAAAEELGVDPQHIRAAVAEEQLGLLSPARRRMDSIVGPGHILVSRNIDMDPDTATEALEAWLTKSLMFNRVATGPDGCSYVRRKDMWASVHRTTGSLFGSPDLSRVTAIDVRATSDGRGGTIVVIEADMTIERVLTVAAGAGVAGVGSAVSVVGAFMIDPNILPLIGIPASLGLSGLIMYIRGRTVSAVRLELDRIFELVTSGTTPGMRRSVGDAAKRLMGGRTKR